MINTYSSVLRRPGWQAWRDERNCPEVSLLVSRKCRPLKTQDKFPGHLLPASPRRSKKDDHHRTASRSPTEIKLLSRDELYRRNEIFTPSSRNGIQMEVRSCAFFSWVALCHSLAQHDIRFDCHYSEARAVLETVITASVAATLVATAAVTYLRSGRLRLYKELGARQRRLSDRAGLVQISAMPTAALPDFERRLAVLDTALPKDEFERLRTEIERLVTTERSYLPTHKKGGTVAYETLCNETPEVVAVYLSPRLRQLVSAVVGEKVEPTPLHDQSSCSVLFYERPGDHIGWHFDHNFYKGRHFTVLIPIVNCNVAGNGLSAAKLMAKVDGQELTVETPPNKMIVFEGARVMHKVTPIADGERRIILSMTYGTDPRNSLLQGAARRIKDTAFFGIRALWT